MKRKNLLVTLVLVGLQGVTFTAFAGQSTFPADAEASYDLSAIQTRADRYAGMGDEPAWGVSKREVTPHDPFPFGGGIVDGGE